MIIALNIFVTKSADFILSSTAFFRLEAKFSENKCLNHLVYLSISDFFHL